MKAVNAAIYVIFIYLLNMENVHAKSMNIKQYNIIESYMDINANPCTDFYQYACGNWEKVHKNESFSDTFEMVDYKINQEYSGILKTRKHTMNRQHRFVKQVLLYYKSCTSLTEFELKKYLKKLERYENITWPEIVPSSGQARDYYQVWLNLKAQHENVQHDWLKLLAILRKYGLNGILITESVLPKHYDSKQSLVEIDRPMLEDEFEMLDRQKFDLIMDYMDIKGTRKAEQLWQNLHNFELKVLRLYDIEDTIGYEEVILEEISIPEFQSYLEIILEPSQFNLSMIIGIANRAYFHALFKLLKNYDNEFISRYIMIRFLWHLHYDGPTYFENLECISNLRDQMPLTMTWLHEQNNLDLLTEIENVKTIFENLRTHFLETLAQNPNSFDDEIVQFLSTKLKRTQLKVGNLPRNSTVETLESFHRELTLSESDFYGNHLKILRFRTRKQHELLQKTLPQNPDNFYYLEDAGMAATSTPYYLQRYNIVVVPLTLLHLPLYHPKLHDIYKYSLIGFLLAHEITHGFDESGLDYDENGNMRESLGNTIKENKVFDAHLDCLLAKNPKIIDEKIADVSGLRWAYETYFSNLTQAATNNLPWSKLPQEKLFFRNFALFFCGSISNEEKLVNSTHGTYRSRLYDTLNHFTEFGRVYDCPEGTLMNPLRKCQLWR